MAGSTSGPTTGQGLGNNHIEGTPASSCQKQHQGKNQQQAENNFYAYVVSFAAALGGLLFGYEIGIIDTVLKMQSFQLTFETGQLSPDGNMVVDLPSTPHRNGNIVSSFLVGCVIGSLIVWSMADKLGRRVSILIGSVVFSVGGAVQAFANNILTLYLGRAVSGIGVGMLSMAVPVYISEAAPTSARGRMISVQQLMITIGIFVASAINGILFTSVQGDGQWRTALGIQIVPGILLLIIMLFFLPPSPRWLIRQGRDREAIDVLGRFRSCDPQSQRVIDEYHAIRKGHEAEMEALRLSLEKDGDGWFVGWKDMGSQSIRGRVMLGMALQFFQQWTGINVIMYFAADLFEQMGFDRQASSTGFVIANSLINVVFTLPGMYLIERWGRRKLLLYGAVGMALSHYALTLWTSLANSAQHTTSSTAFAWLGSISMYAFVASFASTWGPVAWVYQSEIYPLRVRAKATAVATVVNWTMNAAIGKISPLMIRAMGSYVYLVFGTCSILMFLFAYYTVAETKGTALEDMDEIFLPHNKEVRQQRRSGSPEPRV
ncbi:hypothetical protein HK102_008026 [Quaeritorhiza haematococci]|nr:hypothetical protein HK102_008026 [Quaeritorhiza haematococci]